MLPPIMAVLRSVPQLLQNTQYYLVCKSESCTTRLQQPHETKSSKYNDDNNNNNNNNKY
jgi:hypothetical protein